jgi:hypothetical protein
MSEDAHPDFHLAQVNIMRLKAPLESAQLQPFVAALEPVNALADRAPGFVWRLQSDLGDATAYRFFGDDSLLVNMSTWTSIQALTDYVYRSAHVEIMRRRREFALPIEQTGTLGGSLGPPATTPPGKAQLRQREEAFLALWWVRAGEHPTVQQAEERLRYLRANGPTPFAFGIRAPFPPPSSSVTPTVRDGDRCSA